MESWKKVGLEKNGNIFSIWKPRPQKREDGQAILRFYLLQGHSNFSQKSFDVGEYLVCPE